MARPSRPWFRFYVEAVHDRKLRRLKPEHRWLFVCCLAAARQSHEPGWLLVGPGDPMGTRDLIDFAGMSPRAVELGMGALEDVGVIRHDGQRGAWHVPNWGARQYESDDITARTRKHRSKERSNDVPGNVPAFAKGTGLGVPETDTETDNPTPTPPPPEVVTSGVRCWHGQTCSGTGPDCDPAEADNYAVVANAGGSIVALPKPSIDPCQVEALRRAREKTFGLPDRSAASSSTPVSPIHPPQAQPEGRSE
jgi:hypothetical protein